MTDYYVNKNADAQGNHEVHKKSCPFLPNSENRIYLGSFFHCREAVKAAKRIYPTADGGFHCSPECHNQ